MKKIPLLFLRNPDNLREIFDVPNSLCQWVFDGEGVATRKYDGTSCMVRNNKLYKRREVKPGREIPEDFILEEFDSVTKKSFGWVSVCEDDPQDKYHVTAFRNLHETGMDSDGTYELLGPKIQGNPENIRVVHILLKHSEAFIYDDAPRTYSGLEEWFKNKNIEGLVFHHSDGRMAKIRLKDFNLSRKGTNE